MDELTFDAIAKHAATSSRRQSLRFLAGALIGGPLAILGRGEAKAACARAGRKCDNGKTCCPGARCKRGRCRCKPGLKACNGRCVDMETNLAHCGGCDRVCLSDETCAGGRCCDASQLCGGTCVDTWTDANHCGGCGNACGQGQMCQDGACVGACPSGQRRCGFVCADTSTSNSHCGQCNTTCPLGKTCQGGVCVNRTCPAGEDFCAGNNAGGCNGIGSCVCRQTTAGATRCVEGLVGTCGECTTDAQCEAIHGAGALCVTTTGPGCTCPANLTGRCVLPC